MELDRTTYYDLIHHGVTSLLAERFGHHTDVDYHHYLSLTTGKSCCFAMSDEELQSVVDELKNEGYLEDIKRPLGLNSSSACQ